MARLEEISAPRHQSCIVYSSRVLLATRILSAVFYIDSMRKANEEVNSETVIANIGYLRGKELEEAPHWETVNNYLKRVNPEEPQKAVCELARRLMRSKAFDGARIRGSSGRFSLTEPELSPTGRNWTETIFLS